MLKPWYASQDEIPEWARQLYSQKNGRWEFDGGKVDGLAEFLNPAVAAKKDEFQTKYLAQKAAKEEAETKRDEAQRELSTVKQPGTVILSADENKLFTEYKEIGTPKDLKKIKAEHADQGVALAKIETEKGIDEVAKQTKLNPEVLKDLLSSDRGKGLKVIAKAGKIKDAKGVETDGQIAFAVLETPDPADKSKFKVEEKNFLEYAQANLPGYMVQALTTVGDAAGGGSGANGGGQQRSTGRLPVGSGSSAARAASSASGGAIGAQGGGGGNGGGNGGNGGGEGEKKSFSERANDRRSTRPSAWEKRDK
jgi:hypothetical protein